MVKLEDSVIARLQIGESSFEILVDPKAVQMIRDGKEVNLMDYLVIDEIFKDARKGERVSEEHLKKNFGTEDVLEIAKIIIQKGEVQLTTEQRRQMQEAKRRQIVEIIARNAINPQTGTPHPPARIESAIKEAKVHIDPFKPADAQVQDVLSALRPIIPIKFDTVKIAVKLSPTDYPRVIGDIKGFGKITQEEWQSNGYWIGIVEMPAGMQTDFFEKLNHKTKGAAETRILKSHS
ncbi:MAG: ribosome assembly factor SBDS [Thermoplasmata archaeon]